MNTKNPLSSLRKCSLRGRRGRSGFALVVTVTLMMLLTILCVGLLGLSAISLRGAGVGSALAEARANARLAMMLALGDLQRHAGPDARATASAEVLSGNHPPLTGVWRGWEGTNHDTRQFLGRPIVPNYASKQRTEGEGGRFLSWLVSHGGSAMKPEDAGTLVRSAPFTNSVALLSSGTLESGDKREVHVAPVGLAGRGGMAWWVSAENQKARLPRAYRASDDTPARWSVIAKSHSTADPKPFGLESLLDNAELVDRVATLGTADFLASQGSAKRPRVFFHDLSVDSVGLLTNTATGGWRKDLSLLTENWAAQPKSGLPLFRLTPTRDTQASIPTPGNPYPMASMLYPWATYRGGGGHPPIYRHGPVTSWENLVDYATHYKRITASATGRAISPVHSVAIDSGDHFGFIHRVRILPLIARMQWVFSHSAAPAPSGARGLLEPRLLLTPVITMWNPYNVEITQQTAINFSIPKPLPAALRYTLNGAQNPGYNAVMTGLTNQPSLGGGVLQFTINQPFTLLPGETRMFSPASTVAVADTAQLVLQPGYRSGGGHFFPVRGPGGQRMELPPSAAIRAEAKFDTTYHDGHLIVPEGVGIYLDMSIGGPRHLVYRMIYTKEVANTIYPPMRDLAEGTLAQCQTNPLPFLSTIFGARTASRTHFPAKGFLQSSPLVNYTAMGRKDEGESTIARHYGGTAHPVNSPFDYSFVRHAPAGDSMLPNSSDTTGRGYIVTGFNKADGLSRCVIAELPVRPMVSLGELVNWDLRYENPIPPYAINLIGNSDATPLLPANAVVNSRDASLAENLQYDDSYCANHVLFDDWFLSSIAPDPRDFGNTGNLQTTFTDFVSGKTPLANRAYLPIREDRAAAEAGGARKVFTDHVSKVNAWQTIASRLEVEGMFNVNSTSVKAWRALLGHARDQKVPHIRESGRGWTVGLSGDSDHVLSRFSIAGDAAAGGPGSGGAFPEATEFSGYRTVDDSFIDALAEKVVEQVRARGPFLSLAEFVNRQLSSGNLALAGTIQAALNELAKSPSTSPFGALQALSTATVPPDRTAEYQFPEAGVGYSGYGMPGWTRQADILRPLAPILSARDDTFTIRAYGEARGTDGRVTASAVCEAVVRRTREFVDPGEVAELTTAPVRPVNRSFGRRFEVVSFRWLSRDEV